MIVLYKIKAKVIATRLSPILGKVVTLHQHGFIKGRSIYDNILAAMVGIDYAKLSNQECVLLQLDLDKAYDRIGWSLISKTMEVLGLGHKMCLATLVLGARSSSHLLFNGQNMEFFKL